MIYFWIVVEFEGLIFRLLAQHIRTARKNGEKNEYKLRKIN